MNHASKHKRTRSKAFAGLIAAGLILTLSATAAEAADTDAGMALAIDVYERPDGDDAATRGSMILREEGRSPREREMVTLRLDRGDDETRTLIRFDSPADIRDTALLMHDHARDTTDQWLYLPALDRIRRIASNRRGGRFVSSDFFYEDLQDRHPSQDVHEVTGTETIDGAETTRLESIPRDDGEESVYSRRVRWIHEETLIPIRVDFYQNGEEPTKRLEVQRIERHQGYWTVMSSIMTDLESGHRTELRIDAVTYDQGIPDHLFVTETLRDAGAADAYLP